MFEIMLYDIFIDGTKNQWFTHSVKKTTEEA